MRTESAPVRLGDAACVRLEDLADQSELHDQRSQLLAQGEVGPETCHSLVRPAGRTDTHPTVSHKSDESSADNADGNFDSDCEDAAETQSPGARVEATAAAGVLACCDAL